MTRCTIEAAIVVGELGSIDPKLAPINVRQARELVGLPAETAAAVMTARAIASVVGERVHNCGHSPPQRMTPWRHRLHQPVRQPVRGGYHGNQLIRETGLSGIAWVHVHSDAGYCAASSPREAWQLARRRRRRGEPLTMAEPV